MKQEYLKNTSTLTLSADSCTGCGMCESVCPHAVFAMAGAKARIEALDRCMECGACAMNCPTAAIEVSKGVGCAQAVIQGWLKGTEPSCDCSGGCC